MIRINFFKNFNLGSIKSLRGGAEASGESQAKPIPAQPTVAAKGMPASLDPVAMDGKGGDTMAGKVEHQPFAKDTLVDYQQESQSEWKLEPRAGKIIGPETAAVGYKEMGPESMTPRNLRGGARADEPEFKNFKNTQTTQTSAADDELQSPKDSGWIKE